MKASKYPPTNKVEFAQNPTHRNRLTGLLSTLMASAAIMTLSTIPAGAAVNVLTNPGFELGLTGWTIVAPWTWNGPSYAVQNTNAFVNGSGTIHVAVRSGTNAFKQWGYFQTYATTPGAMQTLAAAPGSTWSADGWANTQLPDNMQTNGAGVGSRCYLQMLFLDASQNYNAPLASYTSDVTDITTTPSTWVYHVVNDGAGNTNLTAPGGTAFVRLQMIFAQPGPSGGIYAGGSCYWDDLRLLNTSKPDPEITVQPAPITRVYGQTATFSVTADGLTSLSYLWQKDGGTITDPNAHGITTATLTISNVTTASQGTYTCRVSDSAGPLTSDGAYLTVQDPGVISVVPAPGQTKLTGQSATITVTAAGSSALTYSWQKDGNPLSNGGRIAGASTNTLTVSSLVTTDTGTYTCFVNGSLQTNSGLKVVLAAQAATNLLSNPGFEDGVFSLPWEAAWTKFNGAVLDTTDNFYDVLNQQGPVSVWDGTYVCTVYASDADDGLYQNVPVVAGTTYHAGSKGYMSHYTPVANTVFIKMQVFFKDAGGVTLETDAARAFATNDITTTDTWMSLQVTNGAGSADLVAPAGAVSATVQIYEFNWSYGGGAGYYDNTFFTAAALPAPTPVSITARTSGGMMNLSFPSTSGTTYEVEYASSLANPVSWHTNSTIAGDGNVKTYSEAVGAGSRFFRLLEHN